MVLKARHFIVYNNGVHSILYWVLFYSSGAVARTGVVVVVVAAAARTSSSIVIFVR